MTRLRELPENIYKKKKQRIEQSKQAGKGKRNKGKSQKN